MLLAEEYGAKVLGVDSLDETMQMLLSGRADATLNAEVSVSDYTSVHPEAELRIAASTPEANQVAIPLKKGEDTETLRKSIDNAIRELKQSGELAELSMKYFGIDLTRE
jgi:cystine transport system substrate-binding protein